MCRLLLGCVPKLRGKLQRTGKFSEWHYQLSLSKKESLSVEIRPEDMQFGGSFG